MASLQGPVILITGGSSGIGAATAERFALNGWQVVATARSAEDLESLAVRITEADGKIETVAMDVTDLEATQALAEQIKRRYGQLDCCFVNAGVYRTSTILDCTPDEWESMVRTNLTGAFYTIQSMILLVRSAPGIFVLNSSVAALKGYAHNGAYGASKWGLAGLGDTLRREEAAHGVRVSVLYPGPVATPIWAKRDGAAPDPETIVPASEIASLVWNIVTADPRVQVDDVTVTPTGYLR
ncbi:MAG: SDR family oxidoreductase [bacterium]